MPVGSHGFTMPGFGNLSERPFSTLEQGNKIWWDSAWVDDSPKILWGGAWVPDFIRTHTGSAWE